MTVATAGVGYPTLLGWVAFVHHFVKGTRILSYVAIPFDTKDPEDEMYFRVVAFKPDGTSVEAPVPKTAQGLRPVKEREGADGEKYPTYPKDRALRLLNYLHGGDGATLAIR